MECVQTDNGFEFTNRFSNSKRDLPTLFEKTAAELGIRPQADPALHAAPTNLPMRPLRWLSPNEFAVQYV